MIGMIGLIPRPVHAVIDYTWGGAHYFAPEMFGFQDEEAANAFSKFRGGSAAATSLLTRYELGVVRVIPYNVHLVFDLIGAVGGLAAPWVFGFDKNEKARNTVLAFALFELGAVALSKRDEMP